MQRSSKQVVDLPAGAPNSHCENMTVLTHGASQRALTCRSTQIDADVADFCQRAGCSRIAMAFMDMQAANNNKTVCKSSEPHRSWSRSRSVADGMPHGCGVLRTGLGPL